MFWVRIFIACVHTLLHAHTSAVTCRRHRRQNFDISNQKRGTPPLQRCLYEVFVQAVLVLVGRKQCMGGKMGYIFGVRTCGKRWASAVFPSVGKISVKCIPCLTRHAENKNMNSKTTEYIASPKTCLCISLRSGCRIPIASSPAQIQLREPAYKLKPSLLAS